MAVVSTTGEGAVNVETPTSLKPMRASTSTPEAAVSKLMEEIRAVARKFADQPLQNPEPGVWAVLTAISKISRQRPQGMNILLSAKEHVLGRSVEDNRFQIGSMAVSGKHCKIFRERVETADDKFDPDVSLAVFLQDTSTNGTYVNWKKIRKCDPKAMLKHGDIIAFSNPPHQDKSYAFVYREVHKSAPIANGAALKRKSDEPASESKRLKGIGIGAPEGPVSLDDVRSLQRSNTDLRQKLEAHVLTIETLRSESRASIARHENDLKEAKETVSSSFLDQIKELRCTLDEKQKEVDALRASSIDLHNSVNDLKERLGVSMQSRVDADEVIRSQKATISELEVHLEEERNQRREEREKAAADLMSAVQRAQLEAQEEIKRQKDIHFRQHKEQQEFISKLQESEKESRLLVEMLRSKLEDARESLVVSEKKVRQLEAQIKDEQLTSTNSRKKSEALEVELMRVKKELESEKVAREEAWAKVSALELEIAGAIRDLSNEKQRYQGARERIILRETQLRAFYSTTEEISALFIKQQEQLKAMQRTLEDEDQYENVSVGMEYNEPASGNLNVSGRVLQGNNKEAHGASTPKNTLDICGSSNDSDDDSTTEKHDCEMACQDGNTQELECSSAVKLVKEYDSNIGNGGKEAVPDGDPVGTEVDHTDTERVPIDTERVLETESPAGDVGYEERNAALLEGSNLAGDTMQLYDHVQVEIMEPNVNHKCGNAPCSPSRVQDKDTHTVRTADLLASEVPGSWAVSTAPSVNGENDSPSSIGDIVAEDDAAASLLLFSDGQAAGSQSNVARGLTKLSEEHKLLNAMIDIVAPEFKQQFQGEGGGKGKSDSVSDAETEDSHSTDNDTHDADTHNDDDAAAVIGGGDDADDTNVDDDDDDDDDEMIEDSVG